MSWNLGSSTSFSFGARYSCSLFLTNACPTIPAESTFLAWQLRFSKAKHRPRGRLLPSAVPPRYGVDANADTLSRLKKWCPPFLVTKEPFQESVHTGPSKQVAPVQ